MIMDAVIEVEDLILGHMVWRNELMMPCHHSGSIGKAWDMSQKLCPHMNTLESNIRWTNNLIKNGGEKEISRALHLVWLSQLLTLFLLSITKKYLAPLLRFF